MKDVSAWERFRRTHDLGRLSAKDAGQTTCLMGWVNSRRDHGNVIFIDLRDREGITQVVLDPSVSASVHEVGEQVRTEFVIAIHGTVRRRPDGMVNASMATGEIEVVVSDVMILNKADNPPFQILDNVEVSEAIRLKYRYLDLRRPKVRNNILTRIKFVKAMRTALEERGFLDIETPFLYKSTPEGAREFLVPSRMHPGHFYALPQSPQLFKQVLMVAGFDKYYQVVKCFRDEDLRADRQPEFTQIDCETSFMHQDEIMATFEEIVTVATTAVIGREFTQPFPRMTYATAMAQYGCDKPDTRFELKLQDLSEVVANCGFQVFASAVATGGIVNAIRLVNGAQLLTRKDLDELVEFVKKLGAKGLAYAKILSGSGQTAWQSPIAKFMDGPLIDRVNQLVGAQPDDILFFGAGDIAQTKAVLSALRLNLGKKLKMYDEKRLDFLWVTEFPAFERHADASRWAACHHPFTAPLPEDLHLLATDPGKVRAAAYDLVLNGNEVAGGSVRIFNPEVQSAVFRLLGMSDEEAQSKFGFLLDALKFGAPPHGGMAFGLDRMTMILAGEDSIRDVIPFPKTNKGLCLMTEAPSLVGMNELRDLHIRVQKPTPEA